MSGEFIYVPGKDGHNCEPPTYKDASYNRPDKGSIWRCECGQYFHYHATFSSIAQWHKNSGRKLRRKLKKLGLAYIESPEIIIKSLEKDLKRIR